MGVCRDDTTSTPQAVARSLLSNSGWEVYVRSVSLTASLPLTSNRPAVSGAPPPPVMMKSLPVPADAVTPVSTALIAAITSAALACPMVVKSDAWKVTVSPGLPSARTVNVIPSVNAKGSTALPVRRAGDEPGR